MARFCCSALYGNPNGGEAWNDGTYSSVKSIKVRYNGKSITSLEVQYGLEGTDHTVLNKDFNGGKHGGTDGQETEIKLEPGEYLTHIEGFYGSYNNTVVIKSLGFQTNRGQRGTVGNKDNGDTKFDNVGNRKIVGFFGKADAVHLYAIGVYVVA